MNFDYACKIIFSLIEWGVKEFYICAGARNVPIIEALLSIEGIIIHSHFDERSLAFYALGRIKELNSPVAVVVTSGTAVGELLPAIMEAFYSDSPLVAITADRPKRQRGTGAPQTAEQKDIFGRYVSSCLDIEVGDHFNLRSLSRNKPLHINACFDIPLQSNAAKINIAVKSYKVLEPQKIIHKNKEAFEIFKDFLQSTKNIIIIVSKNQKNYNSYILQFLKVIQKPVYLESISNLRENPELLESKLLFVNKIWDKSQSLGINIDGVIKIGNTPTHKIWRDIDDKKLNINVLSISESHFSGAERAKHLQVNYDIFFANLNEYLLDKKRDFQPDEFQMISNMNSCFTKLNYLLETLPLSEASFIQQLSKKIPKYSKIYLGNSLPIRTWDLAATYENKYFEVEASRGLNGIDGQISTFLGCAETNRLNVGIFGDLTSLYDLQSLWALSFRKTLSFLIVIINNSGGQIFTGVLSGEAGELCKNVHPLNFKLWAEMWGVDYFLVQDLLELDNLNLENSIPLKAIIEIKPCNLQTVEFNKNLKQL